MSYGEFYTFAKGKTAKDAFEKAKKDHIEKYGEDSHSCSLAQKNDFVLIESDINFAKKAYEKQLSLATTLDARKNINNERKQFDRNNKKSGKGKALSIAYLLIGIEHELVKHPNSPAVALPVTKNNWLFFGLAKE